MRYYFFFLATMIIGFTSQVSFAMHNSDLEAFIVSELSLTDSCYNQDNEFHSTILQACLAVVNDGDEITKLKLLPDNKLAVGLNSGIVKIIDLETNECLHNLEHDNKTIDFMFCLKNMFCIALTSGPIEYWNLSSDESIDHLTVLRNYKVNLDDPIDDLEDLLIRSHFQAFPPERTSSFRSGCTDYVKFSEDY